MNLEVVVARYNENINWLRSLNCKVTIYDKGNDVVDRSIKLPNIGRESQTYFYHIVKNYDNLADWTIFTQAHPFDHVKDMDNIVQHFPHYTGQSVIINLDNQAYFYSNGAFNRALTSDTYGQPYHVPELNIDEIYKTLYSDEPPKTYEFTAGCIFSVSKERLLSKPKEFYIKCLELSETREKAPWEFERIMQYIIK